MLLFLDFIVFSLVLKRFTFLKIYKMVFLIYFHMVLRRVVPRCVLYVWTMVGRVCEDIPGWECCDYTT